MSTRDGRSFQQHFDEDVAPLLAAPTVPKVELDTVASQRAVVALAELRGFALASPADQSRFIRERVDACLDAFHPAITDGIRRVSGDVLEGRA